MRCSDFQGKAIVSGMHYSWVLRFGRVDVLCMDTTGNLGLGFCRSVWFLRCNSFLLASLVRQWTASIEHSQLQIYLITSDIITFLHCSTPNAAISLVKDTLIIIHSVSLGIEKHGTQIDSKPLSATFNIWHCSVQIVWRMFIECSTTFVQTKNFISIVVIHKIDFRQLQIDLFCFLELLWGKVISTLSHYRKAVDI